MERSTKNNTQKEPSMEIGFVDMFHKLRLQTDPQPSGLGHSQVSQQVAQAVNL